MFIKKPTSRHSVETAVVSKTFGDLRRPFFGRTLNIITASRQVWSYLATSMPRRLHAYLADGTRAPHEQARKGFVALQLALQL